MKNIFTMLSLEKIKQELQKVFTRFPVGILFIVVFTTILLSLSHGDFGATMKYNMVKGAFSCIIGFFFSIGLYLLGESKDYSQLKKNLLQLIPIGYSLIFVGYFFVDFQYIYDSVDFFMFIIISMVGIIGFLFFSPYVKNIIENNGKQSVYYTYFYNLSVVLLTSFILGLILFSLGAIGITAVSELFDLTGYFSSDIYIDWAIISLTFVTPIFGLTKIPSKREFTNNYFNENAFFSFLIKYVAIPFIYLYFIILYLYSAKVLMNFSEWPKGEVSWMVIGFSIFGYVTYIFSYIFEEKNNFIKTFRKYFPYAVVPQVFMLFYAIYLRIAQYDITINRYFVVVFGIWLLLISLYYILSKKKYLGNLTVLLTLFTVIISVGPWSVYSLPKERQLERLKNNLIEANILQGNTIVPLENYRQIDRKLSMDIFSGIKYVCDFNNCDDIKELFPEISKQAEADFRKQREVNIKNNSYDSEMYPSSWYYANKITDTIKVDLYISEIAPEESKIINIDTNNSVFPIDLGNGKKLYEVDSHTYYHEPNKIIAIYNKEKNILEFSLDNQVIYEADYDKISQHFYEIYKDNIEKEIDNTKLIYETEKYTLYVRYITVKNPNIDKDINNLGFSFHGYLLER